ncbi:GGDEF domain-containing protein [Cellvibrio sp. OA-2007]|uniref:GGDEF domain-containing protein n=1 Tax=Cellvibrio sp. OA-2007 TaxID=529823 RepID=UPI000785C626|nr:GGDEF domain-containing protein [Cellvibrio sp. OA-2007]
MNDKHFNTGLLVAILATIITILAPNYFPQKRLTIWPNTDLITYFYASKQSDGTPSAFWLNQEQSLWRCVYPEDNKNEYFACSFNILFGQNLFDSINIEEYTYLNFKINYSGSAKILRIFIRNADPAYSTKEDANSTKFHSLVLHTKDLKEEVQIHIDEFVVADWWLGQYDISRHLSRPDLSHSVVLGIDFVEGYQPGNHDIKIEKIEFVGEWISEEHWYLFILGCWMLGIFSYAIVRLVQLHQQTKYDVQIINQLSDNNAQLQLETDKFRRLSTVDPLTQAYNRFGIDQIVATLMNFNKGKKENKSAPDFALIVVDIDHFKRINDRRGHDTGDRVLQKISAIISTGIRKQDFLGRWGGEEFVVIMPSTRKEFAIALAEKIRMMIYDTVFEPDNPLAVTASFGVSDKLANEDFATTFKRADKALYEAKAQGRNCCVIADDELPL